jgi:hypothetical protein
MRRAIRAWCDAMNGLRLTQIKPQRRCAPQRAPQRRPQRLEKGKRSCYSVARRCETKRRVSEKETLSDRRPYALAEAAP